MSKTLLFQYVGKNDVLPAAKLIPFSDMTIMDARFFPKKFISSVRYKLLEPDLSIIPF